MFCTKMTITECSRSSLAVRVAFLDVGQGDTIVLSCPETHEAIIVDCIDANAVLEYLDQEHIQYIRGIIITHLHADHYSGVADLLANSMVVPGLQMCEVLAFNEFSNQKQWEALSEDKDTHSCSAPLLPPKRVHLEDLRRWRERNKLKYTSLKRGAGSLPFKGFFNDSNLQLLHPYDADYTALETKGLNNTSIVLRVIGPKCSALLMGDLEPAGLRSLLANHPDINSDILKFPHHGGAWNRADTRYLLDKVQPSAVVLSVGTDGEKYKHPNKEVFDALSSPPYSHIRVLCTQATSQCQESIMEQKKSVLDSLDHFAASQGRERVGSHRGCPCAGTIIAELRDKASILQPPHIFHRDEIIGKHFHSHKCVFT